MVRISLDTNSDRNPVIKGVTVRAALGKLSVRVKPTLVAGFLYLNFMKNNLEEFYTLATGKAPEGKMAEVLADIATNDPQQNEDMGMLLKGMEDLVEKYPNEIDDYLKAKADEKRAFLYSNKTLNMFCSKCGTEYNVESTNFCPKCGTPLPKAPYTQEKTSQQITFYKIGTTKLLILSVITLWLFEFYWFYKNWAALSKHDKSSKLTPFIGALFFPLSSFVLFKRALQQAKESGYPKNYSAGWLAFIFFLLTYVGGTLINDDAIFYQHSDEASLWLFLIGVYIAQAFILTVIQRAVNHGK
jgi:rubrerythrin